MTPLYGWTGPGKTRELTLDRSHAPDIASPSGATVVAPMTTKLIECTVCDRRFKQAMIAARHFSTSHSSLKTEKDSWREHTKEVWV